MRTGRGRPPGGPWVGRGKQQAYNNKLCGSVGRLAPPPGRSVIGPYKAGRSVIGPYQAGRSVICPYQ